MKNAIIFHGSSSTPNDVWYPYARKGLEAKGYEVSAPQLPAKDILSDWLPVALRENYDNETVIIGHSSGAPLILSVLEKINTKIKKVILVSGYISVSPNDPTGSPILQDKYDWEKIKKNAEEFVFINSTNDPWGCNDKQGRAMFDKLGGTLVINNEGHMGSDTFKQPYKEFPFLLNLID